MAEIQIRWHGKNNAQDSGILNIAHTPAAPTVAENSNNACRSLRSNAVDVVAKFQNLYATDNFETDFKRHLISTAAKITNEAFVEKLYAEKVVPLNLLQVKQEYPKKKDQAEYAMTCVCNYLHLSGTFQKLVYALEQSYENLFLNSMLEWIEKFEKKSGTGDTVHASNKSAVNDFIGTPHLTGPSEDLSISTGSGSNTVIIVTSSPTQFDTPLMHTSNTHSTLSCPNNLGTDGPQDSERLNSVETPAALAIAENCEASGTTKSSAEVPEQIAGISNTKPLEVLGNSIQTTEDRINSAIAGPSGSLRRIKSESSSISARSDAPLCRSNTSVSSNDSSTFCIEGNKDSPTQISKHNDRPKKGVITVRLINCEISLRKLIKFCSVCSETLEYLELNNVYVKKIKGRFQTYLQYAQLPPKLPPFPRLRVVKFSIIPKQVNDPSDSKIFDMRQMESLLFFLPPSDCRRSVWKTTLDELCVKINGQVYVRVIKSRDNSAERRTHLVLNRWGRFCPDEYLKDACESKPELESFYCALLPLSLENLQQCKHLKELNLFNCFFNEFSGKSRTGGENTEDRSEKIATDLTNTLRSLKHLNKLIIDFGCTWLPDSAADVFFDLGILTMEGSKLVQLSVGHCKIISQLPRDRERETFSVSNRTQITLLNCYSELPFLRDHIPKNSRKLLIFTSEAGKVLELNDDNIKIQSFNWDLRFTTKKGEFERMKTEDEAKYFYIFELDQFDDFQTWPFRLPPKDDVNNVDLSVRLTKS